MSGKFIDPVLATATGEWLDFVASRVPPNGVHREDGESDADFRKPANDARNLVAEMMRPVLCVYCGTEFPCVCGAGLRQYPE